MVPQERDGHAPGMTDWPGGVPGPDEVVTGECGAVLGSVPDASFDAVVTDPPFGIGKDYDGGREDHADPDAYWAWLGPLVGEMVRVLRPGGLLAVWQSQRHLPHLWEWFGADAHLYVAAKNFVQIRKLAAVTSAWDPVVLLYAPGGPPRRPAQPRRNIDFYVANTASLVSDPGRAERAHPYPRPVDAVYEVVDNFVVPGGSVVDPFAGSGTTGVACARSGRRFLMVEEVPKWADLCRERVGTARERPGAQGRLFPGIR